MKTSAGSILIDSPVGNLLLAAAAEGLTHVLFADNEGLPVKATRIPTGEEGPTAHRILVQARRQLGEYFAGQRQQFDLPLAPRGTEFQLAVWRGLRSIPFGQTVSYGHLARCVDHPTAVRAVGAANGANPISIIVPCHRVIGHDRRLTGFGGGLPRKQHLLELEGAALRGDRVL